MKKTSLSGVWSFSPSESFDGSADRFDVRVPGSWRSIPGLQDCEVGVYSRRFSLRCGEIKEYTVLRFGGVFRKAEVRLNGVDVGKHNGLQSPFAFDVSSIIREGENLLEVLVDSRRPNDELLGFCSVYELIPIDFAGIYEPVELLTYEKAAVTSLYTPVDLNRNKALLLFDTHSTLPNTATGKLLLCLSKDNNCIFEKEFQVVIAPDDGEIRIELPVELFDLWSPENPVLYDVEAALTESGTTAILSNAKQVSNPLKQGGRTFISTAGRTMFWDTAMTSYFPKVCRAGKPPKIIISASDARKNTDSILQGITAISRLKRILTPPTRLGCLSNPNLRWQTFRESGSTKKTRSCLFLNGRRL